MTPLPEWFLAFLPGRSMWWHLFLHPRFGHLLAFGYDADAEQWVYFEPGFEGLCIRVLPRDRIGSVVAYVHASGGVILKCKVEGDAVLRPRLFSSCVTAMVHLLGLRRGCALTPHGLYKSLIRRGAVPAFEVVAERT